MLLPGKARTFLDRTELTLRCLTIIPSVCPFFFFRPFFGLRLEDSTFSRSYPAYGPRFQILFFFYSRTYRLPISKRLPGVLSFLRLVAPAKTFLSFFSYSQNPKKPDMTCQLLKVFLINLEPSFSLPHEVSF